ncbi:unnamed protein product [Allacma fusca]|uniref:Uncharacterized protein n=1 Tax=Allacma fusca TaxID=39272 RepID=A0A8J2P3I9_9HEXA|nr:unnamed protein product [Allacma fusca]
MMEWLDISDLFFKCECPFPRTSADPDNAGLSRERPHGMDKSELHQPGYFTTAHTRWLEAQRFVIEGDLPNPDEKSAESVEGSISGKSKQNAPAMNELSD